MSYQSLEDEDVHSNEDDELEGLQPETSAPATYVPSLFLVLTVHSRRYFLLSFHTGATSFITAICSLDIFTFCNMRSPKYRSQPLGTRSLYALSKSEVTKNIANRFVHSRSYVILYLAMASLSTTTVILSLQDGCPGFAFYILEIIINVAMIAEVSIRFIAFGKVRCIFNIPHLDVLTQRTLAILEIALQRGRPRVDVFVCAHFIGDIIRWLRGYKQGGRIARYSFAGGAERVAIWQACDCHEKVRVDHCCSAGFI